MATYDDQADANLPERFGTSTTNYKFVPTRRNASTIATDPTAGWFFILDNLSTHCSEPLVRMVADQLGIDQATLGVAKKNGILKTMATRRAFLSDPRIPRSRAHCLQHAGMNPPPGHRDRPP